MCAPMQSYWVSKVSWIMVSIWGRNSNIWYFTICNISNMTLVVLHCWLHCVGSLWYRSEHTVLLKISFNMIPIPSILAMKWQRYGQNMETDAIKCSFPQKQAWESFSEAPGASTVSIKDIWKRFQCHSYFFRPSFAAKVSYLNNLLHKIFFVAL